MGGYNKEFPARIILPITEEFVSMETSNKICQKYTTSGIEKKI
jgi:hypothetical protein